MLGISATDIFFGTILALFCAAIFTLNMQAQNIFKELEGGMSANKSLIEVHFNDELRRPEYYDGVHQLLMIGENDLIMSYGTNTTSLHYADIKEIRIRFNTEN